MKPPGLSSWSLDPVLLAVLLGAAWAYTRGYRRARRLAAEGRRPGVSHWLPYACGLLVIGAALMSPIDAIGDRWLLSAHMGQHLMLSDIAPALLVLGLRAPILPLGLPRGGLRLLAPGGRLGRVIGLLTSPWVALPLWAAATWVWAIPSVFDYSAAHPTVHALEHATLFYTGLALWWLIVDPLPSARREPNGRRLAYLGFSRLASAGVCVPLTWITSAAYPLYASAPRAFGISAIIDQRLAGAGMCFVEFLVFGLAMGVAFVSFLGRDEERARRDERVAGRLAA